MEEALIEMYLAGVSVRRVEDITEALWGTRVSPSRCPTSTRRSTADRGVAEPADRRASILTSISTASCMKRSWAGEVRNVSLLVAIAVNAEGYREILGIVRGRQGGQGRLVAASSSI